MSNSSYKPIGIEMYINYVGSVCHENWVKKWKNKYENYCKLERFWWDDYFQNIFLNNLEAKTIRLVLWESCPKKEHNYAFANLDEALGNKTGYLAKVCDLAGIYNKQVDEFSSKKDALEILSRNGWLIIDLYPTHLYKLKPAQRLKFNEIFEAYTIPKLEKIIKSLEKNVKFANEIFIPYALRVEFKETLESNKKNIKEALGINSRERLSFKIYPTPKTQLILPKIRNNS